jgi:signal transduction histidine kinase
MTANPEEDARAASRRLADVLLGADEEIAERAVARMRELLPSYASLAPGEVLPTTLANLRNLLAAIRDPPADPAQAREIFRVSGDLRARQGTTSDDILHSWSIGLEVLRERAYAVGTELRMSPEALLAFVEDTLHWGDIAMRASAWAHRETQVRELGRRYEQQAALRRVAMRVTQGGASDGVLAFAAEQVAEAFRVPVVRIVEFGRDGTMTERAGPSDRPDRAAIAPRRVAAQDGVLTQVRVIGRGVRGVDAAAAPIVVSGEVWGAIAVAAEGEGLPADIESRLTDFAELVAMAIANADARDEVEQLAHEQAALRRIATLVARGAVPGRVFSAVSQEVSRLSGTDLVAVERFDPLGPASIVVGLATDLDGILVGSRWELDDSMPAALVQRTGRSARVDGVDWSRVSAPVGAHAGRLRVRSAVASPIVVEGRVWGAITVASTERLSERAAERLEKFTDLVAVGIANTESREALRQLADGQAALRRVAMRVARASPAEDVFATVAEEVGPLLDAEAGAIHRYEPDGHYTVVGSWGNIGGAFVTGSRWKLERDSLAGRVHRAGRPARVESYEQAAGAVAAEARALGIRSAVGSPILVDGRVWGAMVVGTAGVHPLPSDAEARLTQFAELVATAIANVQTRSDLAASRARVVAASDAERRRVVRDLREGAQQRLLHTIVTANLARQTLERDRREATELVSEAIAHAQTANDELRELAHEILPSILTNSGLGAGLRGLAARMPIPVQIDVPVDRLSPTVEATAYFVVAEALTNIVRAPRVERATVSARVEDRILQLEVRDDGTGSARIEGAGLIELRDRLAALDGRLDVATAAPGTVIKASIPVG